MNLQHCVDQHPTAFAAIFPIYILSLWLLIGAIISFIGGWFSLAKVCRTRLPFDGAKWRMQSGQMRWLTNYNNMLTLGVSPEGLCLASMFLFRFMHPPLLVPWSEIRVRRKKGWVFEYVTFAMGHELAIPLRIRGKLAAKLRESAGSYWPVEDVSEERDPMLTLPEAREIDDCTPDMDGALETVQSNSKSLLFKGFLEISFTPLPVENPRMPAYGGGRQHLIFVREKFEQRTRIVLVA